MEKTLEKSIDDAIAEASILLEMTTAHSPIRPQAQKTLEAIKVFVDKVEYEALFSFEDMVHVKYGNMTEYMKERTVKMVALEKEAFVSGWKAGRSLDFAQRISFQRLKAAFHEIESMKIMIGMSLVEHLNQIKLIVMSASKDIKKLEDSSFQSGLLPWQEIVQNNETNIWFSETAFGTKYQIIRHEDKFVCRYENTTIKTCKTLDEAKETANEDFSIKVYECLNLMK